ncbi:hypothetical protein INT47_001834, partial [Mucor saturninus]
QSVVNPPSPVKLVSYADDLEVFLTGPGEWPVLKSLLDCYGRASNAKVNLSKTVLVSLSGVGHAAWVDIAHSERNLSLRGSGLVANSLLLSRLWHILRVVSVPAKWLDSVQALIRGYLLPFWPRPSMSVMYVSRKFGGVSLVDAHLQQLSLQHIFIQRLISGPNTTDSVSPWLVRGIQLYTSHASILPWFLYPAKFQCSLKRITPLAQLGKILQKLPPLSLSDTWSARWFLDLPLQCVVTVGDAVNTWSPTMVPSSVPLRVKEVRRALYPSDGLFAAIDFLPTALHNQTNRDVLPPTWLPALYHWTIPQGRGNMVTVSGIRPGDLRRYWHPDRAKFEIRAVIPQVAPTWFLFRPSLWRLFWSLDITITSSEDLFHFVVGSFDIWQYWCNVIPLPGICDIFQTEFDVRSGLVSLCDLKQKPLPADMLLIIGLKFANISEYHWRCVIDGDLWNSEAALNMFQHDHSVLIVDNLASQSPLVVNDNLVLHSG